MIGVCGQVSTMRAVRRLAMLISAGLALGFGLQRGQRALLVTQDAHRRGRFAETPLDMTWLGWKDVLARTWNEANEDRLTSVAGSVAFFTLLALVPGLSVLVSIYGLFTEPLQIYGQIGRIAAFLPEAAQQIIVEQARRLTSQPPAALSLNLVISLLIAGWSANAAIKGLFDGLNVIYGEAEKRSFIRFNVISLLTTLGAIALLIAALFVITITPILLAYSPYAANIEWTLGALRWPAFFVIAASAISVLYWIGPSRRPARWPWVVPGALLAALAWAAVSGAFSWYVSTLSDYTATYGSLSAVIVFMTWLWLSAIVILLGAELNAELEHQTVRDSTRGKPKPLGRRGAVVADNIGPPVVRD
jgi:membrane protein